MNLGEPEMARAVAAKPVDGVGLLRAEFMLLSTLQGTHPRRLLAEGRGEEFVSRMAERLQVFAHRGSQGSRVAGATLTAR